MTNTNIGSIRLTKAMKFNALLLLLQGKELPENITVAVLEDFIIKECGLLEKKNTSPKKPTKGQAENEDTKARLLEVLLECGEAKTVTEIQHLDEGFGAMSNQKVSALVRGLVADGKVERHEEKNKAYFKAV